MAGAQRTARVRRMARFPRGLAATALAVSAACAATAVVGPVPEGVWGGPQGNLTVFADSATLDLPCAVGRIDDAVVTDAGGRFDLPGRYAPQAGPVLVGGPEWRAAQYRGSRDGDVLTLTIVLADSTAIGPLQLHHRTSGSFPRCL